MLGLTAEKRTEGANLPKADPKIGGGCVPVKGGLVLIGNNRYPTCRDPARADGEEVEQRCLTLKWQDYLFPKITGHAACSDGIKRGKSLVCNCACWQN